MEIRTLTLLSYSLALTLPEVYITYIIRRSKYEEIDIF